MIGTIRKHSKWLWAVIITAIIITFVYWGAPTGQMSGDGAASGDFGSINGRRITRDEIAGAQREVELAYLFYSGDWPTGMDNENLARETYSRLFLIRKQEELGIHVGNDDVARAAGERLRSINRGNPVSPDAFVNQVLRPRGISADDFGRFIRHELGLRQLISATGLGGQLVTPQEARALYEREHLDISAQAVFFSASNHLDEVTITPEAIAQFYTNQMASYRLPDRVQVAYVQFPASNFMADAEQELAQVPNLTERIEANYERLGGTNFFREARSPDEAKQTIHTQFLKDIALVNARKKANEFATELYAINPHTGENLGKLAAQKRLSAQISEPFDRQYPPPDLKVRADFIKKAFNLTPDEPFADTIVGENDAYVIALHKKLPSEIPALDQIRQRVTEDYKFSRAVSLARQSGSSFAAMLAAGIPNGKTFSTISTEAKVHPMLVPPFSLNTRSLPEIEQHVELSQFKQAAFSVAPGKPGEFVPTTDGGFVVFVQSKFPLDEAKMKADLPKYIEFVRRTRESEAFNKWFSKEGDRALRDTPIARAQPSTRTAPAQ